MNKYFNHLIFRNYIAKARGEHLVEDSCVINGEHEKTLNSSFYMNFGLAEKITQLWNRSPQQQHEALLIQKPRFYENFIICGQLKKRFGKLNGVPHFNKNDLINIPKFTTFIVPSKEENLITGFRFYRIIKDKITRLK